MSKPEHYTSIGTRKFQCNGPQEWSATFKKIAEQVGGKGAPEGIGIRAVLAAGVKAASSNGGSVAKIGEHIEAELAKERSELAVKLAKKAPAKAKAKKAKKVAAAKAKNAKKELPA